MWCVHILFRASVILPLALLARTTSAYAYTSATKFIWIICVAGSSAGVVARTSVTHANLGVRILALFSVGSKALSKDQNKITLYLPLVSGTSFSGCFFWRFVGRESGCAGGTPLSAFFICTANGFNFYTESFPQLPNCGNGSSPKLADKQSGYQIGNQNASRNVLSDDLKNNSPKARLSKLKLHTLPRISVRADAGENGDSDKCGSVCGFFMPPPSSDTNTANSSVAGLLVPPPSNDANAASNCVCLAFQCPQLAMVRMQLAVGFLAFRCPRPTVIQYEGSMEQCVWPFSALA